ncbi:MAG: hypothetical protein NC238_17845 [Dehalobacter sp.]|nr:hypothetical protein [Dehalobacter sp.]
MAKKSDEEKPGPRMQKYEQQELILEERNSYSKTDHDATFMRMKEDPMKNGQLKRNLISKITSYNRDRGRIET